MSLMVNFFERQIISMNKKFKIRYYHIGIVVFVLIGIYFFGFYCRVHLPALENGVVYNTGSGRNIIENVSDEDLNIIKNIFDNQFLYYDCAVPSCGFGDETSIRFNDDSLVFWFACDTCPIVYYKNKHMYFNLSNNEDKVLKTILSKYGLNFPAL